MPRVLRRLLAVVLAAAAVPARASFLSGEALDTAAGKKDGGVVKSETPERVSATDKGVGVDL